MEKESPCFFNSPIIRRNTPIKRLGLSRKRKSCNSDSSPITKIPACDEKLVNSPSHSEDFAPGKEVTSDAKDSNKEYNNTRVNYDEEIELLKVKILEKEEKLKTLQCNKNNIKQLEDLIELWKAGCRNAFLHFSQLIKYRDSENIDLKTILHKLGIWETMSENFQDDCEISL